MRTFISAYFAALWPIRRLGRNWSYHAKCTRLYAFRYGYEMVWKRQLNNQQTLTTNRVSKSIHRHWANEIEESKRRTKEKHWYCPVYSMFDLTASVGFTVSLCFSFDITRETRCLRLMTIWHVKFKRTRPIDIAFILSFFTQFLCINITNDKRWNGDMCINNGQRNKFNIVHVKLE